uniref:t-SNARE coiled-coil homology domain-containing protein n=1 Tax=Panagrolaimus superbus TaxID=310955 RepID=A0A914Z2X0_9BILA
MTDTIIALLGQFEQQYSVSTAEITAKIGQLSTVPPPERSDAVKDIRRMLNDVNDLLEQMDLSVRELESGSADRSKYELRVKSYGNDKKALDAELDKAVARLRANSERSELLGDEDTLQEDQLIANTERLERSSRKVRDAYRTAVETERIAADVLDDLGRQRETIGRARERLREGDADITRSNQLATNMIHRVIQNRLILLIVFVVLMIFLIVFIYRSV